MPKRVIVLTLSFVIVIVTFTLSSAQVHGNRTKLPSRDQLARWEPSGAMDFDSTGLDTFITNYMDAHHIPGLSASIVKNGEVIWTGSFGNAYFQPDIPVSDSTLFMLASISKTMTGTALMQQYDQGLFDLEDPINDYLPFEVNHPDYPNIPITFKMLLTHTSGIRDNWLVMPYYPGDPPTQLGSYLYNYLVPGGSIYYHFNYGSWAPGTQYDYCNNAVALVGYLVEQISGQSLDDYCQAHIFPQLNMYESSYFLSNLDTMHVAMPYHWSGGNYIPYGHFGYSDWPSGQLRTSAPQLLRFLTSYLQSGFYGGNTILDSSTVADMLSSQIPTIDPSQGLIWYSIDFGGRELWGHGGGDQGVTTEMYCCPDENTGVVILTNGESFFYDILDACFDYAAGYGISATIDLITTGPPIQISPFGGSFVFDLEVENTDSLPINFDVWLEVQLPGGSTYGPIILRQDLTLSPGGLILRTDLSQIVPANAPAGEYTYFAKLGQYSGNVLASDGFTFEKLAGDNDPGQPDEWLLSGWETETTSSIVPEKQILVSTYPNPFNAQTTITFNLPTAGIVSLEIFDINGRNVATLEKGAEWHPGKHTITFNAEDLPSGIYFVRLQADGFQATKKMVLLK